MEHVQVAMGGFQACIYMAVPARCGMGRIGSSPEEVPEAVDAGRRLQQAGVLGQHVPVRRPGIPLRAARLHQELHRLR